MQQIKEYTQQAEMCLKHANETRDDALRLRYQKLADDWLNLAMERAAFLKFKRSLEA